MPQYRRAFIPGGSYAFTVVPCNRIPFLPSEDARRILHLAWAEVNRRLPFRTAAVCLLPEHLHCNGLVRRAEDWPRSSFHRYVREGAYPVDWGVGEMLKGMNCGE